MRKAVIAVIVIVCLSLGATWYLHHRGYLADGNAVERTPEVLLRLEGVRTVGRSKGKKTWSIEADKADISRSRVTTTLYDIKNGLIYQDEKPAANLAAGKAVYNDVDRSLEVSEGIKVNAADSEITTSSARYNSWTGTLSCPKKLMLKTKKSYAQANSLEANLKTSEINAQGLRMKVEINELEKALEGQQSTNQGRQ